jgi:hypothetical protein
MLCFSRASSFRNPLHKTTSELPWIHPEEPFLIIADHVDNHQRTIPTFDGAWDGAVEGSADGPRVGRPVGAWVGPSDGNRVGRCDLGCHHHSTRG